MQTAAEKPIPPSPDQVRRLQKELSGKDQIIAEQERKIACYEKLLKLYEEAERLSKLKQFGQSSEKSRFQFNIFDEAELEEALGDAEQAIDKAEAEQGEAKPKKPRKKREGLNPNLPRVRVELTL